MLHATSAHRGTEKINQGLSMISAKRIGVVLLTGVALTPLSFFLCGSVPLW